ncbi:MAG: hypothetical protein IJZ82_04765 [Lachnospiraceae bacterium]|nr:hypothetical protein [Lachnospiraceae bacterium]
MKKKGISFKVIYLIYLFLVIMAVVAALLYVNKSLHEYEALRPEVRVTEAMAQLAADAGEGDFFAEYDLGEVTPGAYEAHMDVEKQYLELFKIGEMSYSQKSVSHEEDELYYNIENDGTLLAEVKLKAVGEAYTRLTVLNFREWQMEWVKPLWEAQDYTLTVPEDFYVSINGVEIGKEDGTAGTGNQITYCFPGLYQKPDLVIKNHLGDPVSFAMKDGVVLAEFYDYTLMLPGALEVKVNGEVFDGEVQSDGRVRYHIRTLEKPQVCIADVYGNEVNYEGGTTLPLTQFQITADSRYTLTYVGRGIIHEMVEFSDNPEYATFAEYVPDIPRIATYDIAILEDDAEVMVQDVYGNLLSYDKTVREHNFIDCMEGVPEVPEEIADEVDVLSVAQSWSLFMSNDLPFAEVKPHLIKDSYQYEVARKYATGVDIKFTSQHTLLNPAFSEEKVSNFMFLAENCFSVDISFVKHMQLRTGKKVDDAMNDRFYFVKYDDTDDGVENPTWKIASMKEIVGNE